MVPLKKPKVTVKDIPLMKLSEPATCFELARKKWKIVDCHFQSWENHENKRRDRINSDLSVKVRDLTMWPYRTGFIIGPTMDWKHQPCKKYIAFCTKYIDSGSSWWGWGTFAKSRTRRTNRNNENQARVWGIDAKAAKNEAPCNCAKRVNTQYPSSIIFQTSLKFDDEFPLKSSNSEIAPTLSTLMTFSRHIGSSRLCMLDVIYFHCFAHDHSAVAWVPSFLAGGWPTPLKNMSSSVGMMTFPIYGKIKAMFQTTNQCWCCPKTSTCLAWSHFDPSPPRAIFLGPDSFKDLLGLGCRRSAQAAPQPQILQWSGWGHQCA